MAAEELRMAVKALSKITGHIDVEEVLDVVFKDFCIGKWSINHIDHFFMNGIDSFFKKLVTN